MPDSAVPILGAVAGGLINQHSADNAIDAQTAAADKAAEIQKYMYDTSRADLAPYRQTGVAANSRLSQLLGLSDLDPSVIRDQLHKKYPGLANIGNLNGGGAGGHISSPEASTINANLGRQIYATQSGGGMENGRPTPFGGKSGNNIGRLDPNNDSDMQALAAGYGTPEQRYLASHGGTKTPEQIDLAAHEYSNMYSPGSDIGLSAILGGAIRGGLPGAVMGGIMGSKGGGPRPYSTPEEQASLIKKFWEDQSPGGYQSYYNKGSV